MYPFLRFLIVFFMLLYSFDTSFTKNSSSWLTSESIKAIEIKSFIVFNLVFANNTILHGFFFFLILDLYFLIPEVAAQVFNPTAELEITIGIPSKKAKV